MGEYSEAFVAFDVSKTKHAVAIADGGRGSEVRFLGEVANTPAAVERLIRRLLAVAPAGRSAASYTITRGTDHGPNASPSPAALPSSRLALSLTTTLFADGSRDFARACES